MEEEGKAVVAGKESEARGLHAPQCAGGKEAACDESGVQVCSGKGQAGGEAAAFAQRLVAAAGFERRLKGSVGLFFRGSALRWEGRRVGTAGCSKGRSWWWPLLT